MPDIPNKPADSYRLLHTADWHLGKLLNDQSRDEEHARFLDWLLGVVNEHAIDAIVLAGDVFDSANPPQSALARYYDFVSGLHRQGSCALVVISGNHDSAGQLEAPKQALRALNVHVTGFLSEDPESRLLCLPNAEHPRVAVALVPFLRDRDLRVGRAGETVDEIQAQIVAGIHNRYRETAEAAASLACPLLATGHLTVVGATASDSEREIHIGGLGAVSAESFPQQFSYVALGHLHRPQSPGSSGRVRYAGSPIALSFSEANDDKEVRILDVSSGGISQHSLAVPVFRHLAQIRTRTAALADDLAKFSPAGGDLTTWVEILVEDATLETDLVEKVRSLSEGLDFEILKVLRGRSTTIAGMAAGEATDDEVIDSLLDRPVDVFEHLLTQHEELSEEEVNELKTAFAVLVDLDAQSEGVQSS